MPFRPLHEQLVEAAKRFRDYRKSSSLWGQNLHHCENRLAHSSIQKLIDECRRQKFAEQAKNDLQFLHLTFNEVYADGRIKMRETIRDQWEVYLDSVYLEKDGGPVYTGRFCFEKTRTRDQRIHGFQVYCLQILNRLSHLDVAICTGLVESQVEEL